MKKHILFLVFLLTLFVFRINAQTLKNIHRHNLPVLQIPVDLIDKVETVEIDDQKHLQVHQFNGFINDVLVSQIDSITHSDGEALDPAQLGNLRTASIMGIVRGPTGAAEMNAIVRSPYGGEETRTDPNGVFFLNNIVVYDKLGYITITKAGFHKASRSFLPLESGSNRIIVQLLPMTQSGTFSASIGGTVTSGLLQLSFPANAVTLNGQPFMGLVNVYAKALDPSLTEMYDQMPGDLLGGMNDSLRLLRSFGMAAIELRDDYLNELQLAQGASVTLTFNIPSTLQTVAPATIDWWSFDEALGYWKHEGVAQKQGNNYVGQASHFSWWNLDVPFTFNDFFGTIILNDGEPVSNARINLFSPTVGNAFSYANSSGEFAGRVPENESFTLNVDYFCHSDNNWQPAYNETIYSEDVTITGIYIAQSINFYPITGTVVNCEGQSVASGYVRMGSQIYLADNGEFIIQACSTAEYVIRGFNISNPDSIKVSAWDTIQVGGDGINIGELQACDDVFGLVADIDGNIYPTVLIGNQWWMAANLRTSIFNEGSLIPNETSISTWDFLTTPAWCNYGNNVANDSIYGKQYNWYTVNDTRGVCPTGWHIPTDEEWTALTNYLGGESIAGRKMKSETDWNPYVTPPSATNESGFTGLPGGQRDSYGYFNSIGNYCWWWSATELSLFNAWYRAMDYSTDLVTRSQCSKQYGFSVRCVKD